MVKTMNYEELYEKMLNDEEFLSKTKKCESFEELYKLYCDYGYTDLEYESFKSAFEARVNQLEANGSKYQLSVDELDTVVGGSLWGWVKKAINFVPFVGPLVTTTIEVCTGELKGVGNIAARYGIAVASGLFATTAAIATGGASIGAKVLIKGGISVLKGAGNVAVGLATS